MNAPRPERQPLAPVAEILGEALSLYGRNAPMLIAVAAAGALAGSLAGLLLSPSAFAAALLWSLFIASVVTGAQAPVWLMAVLARRGEPLTSGAVLYGLVAFGPRFFGVGLLFSLGSGAILLLSVYVPVLSVPALPILIYFVVLFSLATPVIVQERRTPVQAVLRSMNLVMGKWWRTFLVQAPVVLFGVMLVVMGEAVASRVDAAIVTAVVSALALGISAPLVALVETALFEEYSRPQAHAVEEGAEE